MNRVEGEGESADIQRAVTGIVFLTLLFFLNFLSRIIFSPLLPNIQSDFNLNNSQAGSLFLIISCGYFISIVLSGFVSARVNHANTIWISALGGGGVLLLLSVSQSITQLFLSLFCLGLAAGLYLPSGLGTIFASVPVSFLARGMAIHELAPNLGFFSAPLLWGLLSDLLSWRQSLAIIALLLIVIGTLYSKSPYSCKKFGNRPKWSILRKMISEQNFWCLVFMFSGAIALALGIYSLLPLFLVTSKAMSPDAANYLTSVSRVFCLAAPFLGGWLGDRYGNTRIMCLALIISGVFTVMLGLSDGVMLIVLIVLQPTVAVCFFPPGLAVLSSLEIGGVSNVAISFCIPLAFLFGGGVTPMLVGAIGDVFTIGAGFSCVGIAVLLVASWGRPVLRE